MEQELKECTKKNEQKGQRKEKCAPTDWSVFKISPFWKRSGRLPAKSVKRNSQKSLVKLTGHSWTLGSVLWDCIRLKLHLILSLQQNIAQIFTADVSQLQANNTHSFEWRMGSKSILSPDRGGKGGCVHLFLPLLSGPRRQHCLATVPSHSVCIQTFSFTSFETMAKSFKTWGFYCCCKGEVDSSPFWIQVHPPTGTKDWRLSEGARGH